ncbi:unnamed protein product [Pleuronectes platessa]|uniref:Uncharacterized protein n=1 Tax=Pleuronectes platessa TaxID=8262 RepID=A0A9N7TPX2_PLEPL|nr:unnamed protein product [Pleuronectes platessa]
MNGGGSVEREQRGPEGMWRGEPGLSVVRRQAVTSWERAKQLDPETDTWSGKKSRGDRLGCGACLAVLSEASILISSTRSRIFGVNTVKTLVVLVSAADDSCHSTSVRVGPRYLRRHRRTFGGSE